MIVEKTACFIGHRKIDITESLKERLYNVIEDLMVSRGVTHFLFGSNSQFDSLCHEVVSNIKNKYPYIKRVYVRAQFQKISKEYEQYLLTEYEDTFFAEKAAGAGRLSYIQRNYNMIDKSCVCVVYYNKDYLPERKQQKGFCNNEKKTSSGTALAVKYAQMKNKDIINVCEM